MSRFDRIVRRHGEPGAEGGEAPARPRLNSRRKRRLAGDRARFAALESLSQPIDFGPVFEAAGVEQPASIRDRYLARIAVRRGERAAARGES